jgi:cupin 2 domain-containing protein
MPPALDNLFQLPQPLPEAELFATLFATPHLRVERIVSTGQTTPPGEWYDQPQAEWVVLLTGSATLTYEDGSTLALRPGDHLLIPAHVRHRVDFTSREPPCVWLAVHG